MEGLVEGDDLIDVPHVSPEEDGATDVAPAKRGLDLRGGRFAVAAKTDDEELADRLSERLFGVVVGLEEREFGFQLQPRERSRTA